MRLWVIDKNNISIKQIRQDDFLINFTCQQIIHPNLLELSAEYNLLRRDIKDKYIKFIAELGNAKLSDRELKNKFPLENTSLWWFSRISLKDSFSDSLFDDICKTILIKRILIDKDICNVTVLTDSPWLENLLEIRKIPLLPYVFNYLLSRFKLAFLHYLRIKIFLIFSFRSRVNKGTADILFNTYFPGNWNRNVENRYTDRFFRDLPEAVKNSGYLVFLEKCETLPNTIKEPVFIIQNYLSFFEIIISLLNLRNLYTYLLNRDSIKKLSNFEGIDLGNVYDLFFLQAVILDEFFFRLIIKGVKRIARSVKPKKILTVGEFGIETRATITGARFAHVCVEWFQHEVISDWKLWYFNHASEICQQTNLDDCLSYMPVADNFIVWGEHSLKIMEKYGYPQDRMVALGNPRFDSFVSRKISFLDGNMRIIFAPTIDKKETLELGYAAIRIKEHYHDINVVLKLHPRYLDLLKDPEVFRMCALAKSKQIDLSTENVEKYYSLSTLFICGFSSVAIEAAYFGIKSIIYQSKYFNRFTPAWEGESTHSDTLEKLIKVIDDHERIRPLDWGKYYLPPGTVVRRVTEFLENSNSCGVQK